jgi:SAM-dependent methyltransferase
MKLDIAKQPSSYSVSEKNFVQWGLPFSFILRRPILLRAFLFLFSHYGYSYRELVNSKSLLDVGTGLGMTVKLLRKVGFNGWIIGVDIMRDCLVEMKEDRVYDDLVLGDAAYLPFKEKSFDAVSSFQMVEHIPKSLVFDILEDFERIGRATILVTTPVGFVEADVDPLNPWQKHKAGWLPREFKELGFTVVGYGMPKVRRATRFSLPFLTLSSVVFFSLFALIPETAFHMLCIKNVKDVHEK